MQSKSLLIAIAAFAVTVTGVHAYGGNKILTRAGLTDEQVSAIEQAQELRVKGDFEAARDKLVEAGVTEEILLSIKEAAKDTKNLMRKALKDGDYASFRVAVADSPLADIIKTEADFEQYREAYEFRLAGQWSEAYEILDELGVDGMYSQQGHKNAFRSNLRDMLTAEQYEALMVAKKANDRATMQAILDEAGLYFHHRHHTD